MAIYRTDRDRRILGDRVVARQEDFSAIHSAVAEVHGRFVEAHTALGAAFEARQKEQNESAEAREVRHGAEATVAKMYSWAYKQVDQLLQPSWDTADASEDAADVRERLFPLGPPAVVTKSTQMIIDGMNHFIAAAERERAVAYVAEFSQAAQDALSHLREAVAKVTVEQTETAQAVDAVEKARADWDRHYVALREVTSAFLRLSNEHHRLTTLFRGLTRGGGASEDSEAAPETPSADTE
jgi:cell division septum initiation protein DivIVA